MKKKEYLEQLEAMFYVFSNVMADKFEYVENTIIDEQKLKNLILSISLRYKVETPINVYQLVKKFQQRNKKFKNNY